MAEAGRDWVWARLLAVLLLGAGAASEAQTGGVLTGKLTDLHSTPLNGATLVLRNEATGAESRGITQKNGSFRFTGLEPGVYTVEADSPGLGRGRLDSVVVSAGHEARVQAAMAFEAIEGRPAEVAAAPSSPATPTDLNTPPAMDATSAEKNQTIKNQTIRVAVEAQPLATKPLGTAPENAPAAFTSPNPLLGLAALARRAAERKLEEPAISAEASIASLANEPLLTLNLAEERVLGAVRPAADGVGHATTLAVFAGLAVSEAIGGAARAGIASGQFVAKPAHASSAQVDPAANAVVTTLTGAEIQALPAAGRRWQDFVLDTPTAAGGAQVNSPRGAGQLPAETSIDGANTRLAFGGQSRSGSDSSGTGSNGQSGSEQNGVAQAWAGGRGSPVAEAAIREVQTAAGNAEAEGSRTAGGSVNVETARGMNGLHGQGFGFDRQNTWGAQNPFTTWVKETTPATETTTPAFSAEPYTPPDHESVWGIGLGSQIRKDKLFWFAALDSYRRNDPGLATVKNPGEFFAQPSNDQVLALCARLGLTVQAPSGQPNFCPTAEVIADYSGLLEKLDGLLGPAPRTAAQWVGFGRLDWQAAERHRITLEGIGGTWNSPGGGLSRVSEAYGTNSFGTSEASEERVLGRWEAFLTPNLLAVTQGSFGRNILSAHAEAPSAFEQTFLGGGANDWSQLPQINVDNRFGFTIGNPSRFGQGSYPDEHLYQAQETIDWVHGSLLVKGGFELSHNADATSQLRNQTGTYTYSSVENFASDALAFGAFGLGGELQPDNQHNCDETGKVWRDSGGGLRGLGNLPCYSYYSQMIGPTHWNLSTNDWAGFTTVQWRPWKFAVMSGGLRWEREQLPLPIAAVWPPPVAPTSLPGTQPLNGLPRLGNDWGPRISLALGNRESHWPVLRLGYGMYFGRTENSTVETALTQTGSPSGDLSFFMRPTDNLNAGGAPPFPYVLNGAPGSVVKPGAVEFASNFRNPEVHQAVAALEEVLPGHVEVTASAVLSLGRRLPIPIDTNYIPPTTTQTITYAVVNCPETYANAVVTCTGSGPIKASQITVPFYASWPSSNGLTGRPDSNYQQISGIMSRANSTYEAAVLRVVRYGRRGLSLHAHYTYAHATDWNPDESTLVSGSDVLDPQDFSKEYGTSDLDVRNSAAVMMAYEVPWKLHNLAGQFANGWTISGIGQFRSGMPYTMRTSGSLAEEFDGATSIVGLGPGMNGSGGDNRVYGMGSDGDFYNIGRNTFRYPATWKADMRVGKKFDLGKMRELELLVESFNLFNHENVTEIETTGYYIQSGTPTSMPTLNFLNTFTTQPPLSTSETRTGFGQPLNINATNFYRERQIQLGVRMRF